MTAAIRVDLWEGEQRELFALDLEGHVGLAGDDGDRQVGRGGGETGGETGAGEAARGANLIGCHWRRDRGGQCRGHVGQPFVRACPVPALPSKRAAYAEIDIAPKVSSCWPKFSVDGSATSPNAGVTARRIHPLKGARCRPR